MKKSVFTFLLLCLTSLSAIPPQDTCIVATRLDDLISLDPAEIFEVSGVEYAHNTYDRLIFYDPKKEGTFQGVLSERWKVSEDGKEYTFYMKEGVCFASGNPLTAEDAAFSLKRVVLLNKSPAYLFTQFGWSKDNIHEMVFSKNPSTLIIKTDQKYALSLLLYCLTSANAAIVDKKLLLEHEQDGDFGNFWLKTNYAGSGPFILDRWTPNVGLFLKRNEHYFRPTAELKKVVLMSVPEESSQKMLLMTGDVDIARNLSLDQVENTDSIDIAVYPLSMTIFMSMNQKNPHLKIPQVRQAVKHLIDYKNLEKLTRGSMCVHQSFIPKGFFGACSDTPFTQNVEKAKILLQEAGLEEGFSLFLDTGNLEIAQALQSMFAKAHIKLNILQGDSKQVLTKMRARKHDLCISTWIPDYCDPHNNAATFAFNPNNSDEATEKTLAWRNTWDTTEIHDLVFTAMQEQDTEKRHKHYIELQRYFHENAPFVNLFQQNRILAQRKESLKKNVRFMSPLDLLSYYSPEKAGEECTE